MLNRRPSPAEETARRFEAGLAQTLAGELGAAAGAEADDLLMRLANLMTNEDFLDLCRAWAVDATAFRRALAETDPYGRSSAA